MQIFTSQGVYDSRVVNNMKQYQYKNVPSYHTSHIDNAASTFIMFHLDSITIFLCATKIESLYSRGWGMREKKQKEK